MEVAARGGMSLRDVYVEGCGRVGCKKNSGLLKTLPDVPGDFSSLEVLNLNLNCVGQKGVQPLLKVVALAPGLKVLLLADNFLTNESIKDLLTALTGHPTLSQLDFSRNPISHVAGKLLSTFVSTNPRVTQLALEETLINPALVKIIQRKTEMNRAKLQKEEPKPVKKKVGVVEPPPTATPTPNPPQQIKQKEEEEETRPVEAALVFLPRIFQLASEGEVDCVHLELLSVAAAQVHPNIEKVKRRPVNDEKPPTPSPTTTTTPEQPTTPPTTPTQEKISEPEPAGKSEPEAATPTVEEDDDWYGVKLLYNASLHDTDDDQWYGIRSVYAAVEEEGDVLVQEQQPQPSTRRLSIMDPKEVIAQEVVEVAPLAVLRSCADETGSSWEVLDFLLNCKEMGKKSEEQEEVTEEKEDEEYQPTTLKNLDILFDTAGKATEDMSGLEYLRKSMSLLMGASSSVTGEETEEEESPTPEVTPRAGWYAMDLIWSLANKGPPDTTDWAALASVMSIINKDEGSSS